MSTVLAAIAIGWLAIAAFTIALCAAAARNRPKPPTLQDDMRAAEQRRRARRLEAANYTTQWATTTGPTPIYDALVVDRFNQQLDDEELMWRWLQ